MVPRRVVAFIIVEKTRSRGEEVRRCRCYERKRAKLEQFEVSHTSGWKVVSRERDVERRREVWRGRG
jgi:hypothetical protein